jgi:hypothetical protein
MARRRHSATSRNNGARLVRVLILALIGAAAGIMLGELVVGTRTRGLADAAPSFSSLSANPDAAVPQGEGAPACTDCIDSYGVAARLRARRDGQDDAFRELGAVDVDRPSPVQTADDDYRYGGRFPDAQPHPFADMAKVEDASQIGPVENAPSAGAIPPSAAER